MILLQLVALLLQLVGAVLMANAYLSPADGLLAKLALLVSAFFGTRTAEGGETAFEAGFSREQYPGVLRGLALIAAGFLLQALVLVVGWVECYAGSAPGGL